MPSARAAFVRRQAAPTLGHEGRMTVFATRAESQRIQAYLVTFCDLEIEQLSNDIWGPPTNPSFPGRLYGQANGRIGNRTACNKTSLGRGGFHVPGWQWITLCSLLTKQKLTCQRTRALSVRPSACGIWCLKSAGRAVSKSHAIAIEPFKLPAGTSISQQPLTVNHMQSRSSLSRAACRLKSAD